jgi:ubiquinone/menaquinone biosynthesis C-methylase UbiE
MADKKQRIANMFDRTAPIYDSRGPRFFSYFGERLVASADLQPGSRVLDVACGRGAVLFPAAHAVGPGGQVIGIDLSPAMVNLTHREIGERGLANVSVQRMDVEKLDFNDACFDSVVCGFGIFFCTEPDRALQEILRVLRPQGRFSMSTWTKADERRKLLIQLAKIHLSSESQLHEALQLLPKGFEEPTAIENILTTAGFGRISVREERKECVYADEEEWWAVQWTHGIRSILEYIEKMKSNSGLAQFKAEAFEKLQAFRHNDGIHQTLSALFTQASN